MNAHLADGPVVEAEIARLGAAEVVEEWWPEGEHDEDEPAEACVVLPQGSGDGCERGSGAALDDNGFGSYWGLPPITHRSLCSSLLVCGLHLHTDRARNGNCI